MNLRNGLVAIALAVFHQTAFAWCTTVGEQQPSLNTNFEALALSFRVDISEQFSGSTTPVATNTSYTQHLEITQSTNQQDILCLGITGIGATGNYETSANTIAIGQQVGQDYSGIPARVALTNADLSGYDVSSGSYATTFIASSESDKFYLDDKLKDYVSLDYSKNLSIVDTPIQGNYEQLLDLKTYLLSKLGTNTFYYDEIATLTSSTPNSQYAYPVLGKYGFIGTATLLSVTAIPEPQTYALLILGLVTLIFNTRASSVKGS